MVTPGIVIKKIVSDFDIVTVEKGESALPPHGAGTWRCFPLESSRCLCSLNTRTVYEAKLSSFIGGSVFFLSLLKKPVIHWAVKWKIKIRGSGNNIMYLGRNIRTPS